MSLSLPSQHRDAYQAVNSLPEQLIILRRHLRLIVASACLIPLLTGAALAFMKPAYTATGVLIYNAPAPAPGIAASSQDSDALIASQSALITSLPSLNAIATRLNLAQQKEFGTAPPWWRFGTQMPDPNAVAMNVAKALSVSVPQNSRLLNISFTSTDAALSAAAANIAMQRYLDFQRDQAFSSLQQSQSWLQTHENTLQTELSATENQLMSARQAAGIVAGMQSNLSAETASRITASLIDAQSALAMAQARLTSISPDDEASANAAIAPNLLPLRKDQADFSAQVQSLSRQYGPDYPDLVAARASLAAITAEIDAETSREIEAAHTEVAADQAQVATLTHALAAARATAQAEDTQSGPIQALSAQVDSAHAMLNAIAVQADQMNRQAALDRPMASIISEAVPPSSANPRHRILILVVSGFLGLCLGILLAGLMEALDTSFRSGDALQAETRLPCLALIPTTPKPQEAAQDAPFSLYGEQLRSIRIALAFSATRVLAVTAARPGEGKTTLTVALGRVLAEAGKAVLVIDADIRQSSFELIFSTRSALGLTDYLSGLANIDAVIQHDFRTSLHVMCAGTQASDALALFLSPNLGAMLMKLRERYDFILIDVPPAFALAEARILTRAADATYVCVRWGHTPRRVVQAALTMLAAANVKIAGLILTRVDTKIHRRSGFADAEMYQPSYGGYYRHRNFVGLPQHMVRPLEPHD